MTTRAALLGASGFVGTGVGRVLGSSEVDVVIIKAPRIRCPWNQVATWSGWPGRAKSWLDSKEGVAAVADLVEAAKGCEVIVNAAGMAKPEAKWSRELVGANALLPGVVARAAQLLGARPLHVSSGAAQAGFKALDEQPRWAPNSAYSWSKALGDQLFLDQSDAGVLYRATSVQGPEREITRRLLRLVDLPVLPLAAGERTVPLCLVENAAAAVAFLVVTPSASGIVLHPDEGVTTRNLIQLLGGRARRLPVPHSAAVAADAVLESFGRSGVGARAVATRNRLHLLLQGMAMRAQVLTAAGWRPPKDKDHFRSLRIPAAQPGPSAHLPDFGQPRLPR